MKVLNYDMLVLNLFTNKVKINSNILHLTMEHRVGANACGVDIVTKYLRSGRNMKPKLME